MDAEKNFEQWCVSPCMTCPNCDAHPDLIWYDNEEINEWGHFRDATCMECGVTWCEDTGDVFEDDDD